jgi:hypothetical protein
VVTFTRQAPDQDNRNNHEYGAIHRSHPQHLVVFRI